MLLHSLMSLISTSGIPLDIWITSFLRAVRLGQVCRQLLTPAFPRIIELLGHNLLWGEKGDIYLQPFAYVFPFPLNFCIMRRLSWNLYQTQCQVCFQTSVR